VEDAKEYKEQVRIGWFYRPGDILAFRNRSQDPKLLIATMHSDVNPVSSIVGKCYIRHISEIPDLEKWKEQEDCFYYSQLYDRHTTKLYDVIPKETVLDMPIEYNNILSPWQFLLVEAGKGSFFVEMKTCFSCDQTCVKSDHIRCDACKHDFHLKCIGLRRKPPKGFAFQCTNCINVDSDEDSSEDVEESVETHTSNVDKESSEMISTRNRRRIPITSVTVNDSNVTQIKSPNTSTKNNHLKKDKTWNRKDIEVKNEKELKSPEFPFRYFGDIDSFAYLLGKVSYIFHIISDLLTFSTSRKKNSNHNNRKKSKVKPKGNNLTSIAKLIS